MGLGVVSLWLGAMVLLPLGAVVAASARHGFWATVTSRVALDALGLTLVASAIVTLVNVVMGTLIAWVLVRDRFFGKRFVNALIDLPFALPTVVAGIVLLSLYGSHSPFGLDVAFTRWAILLALAFVTLPFVVRSVQPVLLELGEGGSEYEEAAASLGASPATIVRRIVLPSLRPAIVSGAALGFARAVGEFGSVVLISGNAPFHTQVASVYVFGLIESDARAAAASVSVVLLAISLAVLILLRVLERRGSAA